MKFKVRDEDGKEFEIEELEKDESIEKPLDDEDECVCKDDCLSPEEIASLKKLAGLADKLAALVETTDEDEESDVEDEDVEDEEGEQIEEVIDTDEEIKPKKANDSIKKSAVAIEKRNKVDDSVEDDDVAQAWAKRYGGNR